MLTINMESRTEISPRPKKPPNFLGGVYKKLGGGFGSNTVLSIFKIQNGICFTVSFNSVYMKNKMAVKPTSMNQYDTVKF